jgi:hypothetical protein
LGQDIILAKFGARKLVRDGYNFPLASARIGVFMIMDYRIGRSR